MSVTVVLDGGGLQAWAQRVPPRNVIVVMEVLRRAGAGSVLVPSIVLVETLTGTPRDARVNQIVKQVDVDERLPLSHVRAAAALRQGSRASAVDAVVVEAALRTRAAFVITSDPDDVTRLLQHGRGSSHVVAV